MKLHQALVLLLFVPREVEAPQVIGRNRRYKSPFLPLIVRHVPDQIIIVRILLLLDLATPLSLGWLYILEGGSERLLIFYCLHLLVVGRLNRILHHLVTG